MIAYLEGKLVHKNPTYVIVDVGGVGYAVQIPLSSYDKVGEVGGSVKILTYLHVREDVLQLFGFMTEEERERAQRAPKRVWIQVPEGCPAWAVEQAKRDARLFMEDQVEDEAPEEEVLDLVDGLDLW